MVAADPGFALLGNIKSRSAKEITASSWSIGGETLDRDFAVYANYKKFLGPLGAKHIRLQAGWAKCEKKPDVYDWAWLDEIVKDAFAQGVQPWLQTSYGNPIYSGGGGITLGAGLPKSAEALAAWDHWVQALVRRYRDFVFEWEVWNEPDHNVETAPAYARLFIRTAEIIRAEQPKAQIFALSMAGNIRFAEAFFGIVRDQGKLNLIDAVTTHGYPNNPDDTGSIDRALTVVRKFSPTIQIRQGETGAPSKFQTVLALSKRPWSETTQAKWNLRRMLAHHARDVPFNLYQIMDMHATINGKVYMNWKGLLEANPDKTVSHPKLSYFAAQRVFALFDDSVERLPGFRPVAAKTNRLAVTGYRKKEGGAMLVAVWFNSLAPVDSNATTPVDLTFAGAKFTEPVYADLLTGQIYKIPRDRWSSADDTVTFKQMPVYDSPVLIAEKTALLIDTIGNP
ncbi:MAG: hypothetical protein NTY53_23655 [Kiritimatiellaeota bacterium]|nr:hypothetical protein [Kiritimatiellota bacterium]